VGPGLSQRNEGTKMTTLKSIMTLKLFTGLAVLTVGSSTALAQTVPLSDPSLEVFRIRCQIDADINPATGLTEPKVQIQVKARADLLDGQAVSFSLVNLTTPTAPPTPVDTFFDLGSASADWDTFPDPGDLTPVTIIAGDFVADADVIRATAHVPATNQVVAGEASCADKTGAQFKQDTKNVCTLKKFNRGKCKPGDTLPDGTVMP